MDLLTWTKNFIEYKNSFQRDVINIKKTNIGYEVDTKNGVIDYVVLENLSMQDFNSQRIVCLNTKENVVWLANNWDKISQTNAIFLFVDPKNNEHWTIRPKHHNLIADKTNLKTGLLALMESINVYE